MAKARLLHISDLHAGRDSHAQQPIVAAALDDFERLHSDREIDAVIFSGDVAFAGRAGDFEAARESLVEPLLRRLELPLERFIAVPGNHDVDRDAIEPYQEKGLLDSLVDTGAVSALLEHPQRVRSATARLRPWDDFEASILPADPPPAICSLGRAHVLSTSGLTIGVAALNTAWRASGGIEDHGRLIIGEQQVRLALDAIHGCDLRVSVMHHPLSWIAPFDADIARRLFEATSGLVLTGHEHVPDPTSEVSIRGRSVYSRAGCLFQKADHFNGYSLIDVDLDRRQTVVSLRTWWPEREEFDQATNLVTGGAKQFDFPAPGTELVVRPSYNGVLKTFGRLAIDGSLFGDHLAESEAPPADQLLVAPKFWPIPYKEVWAARQVSDGGEDAEGLDPVDLTQVLAEGKTIVIVAEPEAGLSSALLWLLVEDFVSSGRRVPLYMTYDRSFKASRFERRAREFISGISEERQEGLPPANIALDDVVSSPGLHPLAKYIAANPDQRFILGARQKHEEALTDNLDAAGIAHQVVHIGPFGRAQLRELLAAIGGGVPASDQEHILTLILTQHLPRSPFVMTALALVLKKSRDTVVFNESGLLESYVGLLLGSEEMGSEDALGMDTRRREHLLAWFASEMIRLDVDRIVRLEAELKLGGYFRKLGWGEGFSPGQVLENLIQRRILVDDDEGIGFRHGALLYLFAAKAMADDASFAEEILAAPARHAETVKHAAGLRRNDRDVLEAVAEHHHRLVERMDGEVTVEMFDRIKDRPGWSNETPDVRQLKAALEREPARDTRAEEEVDRDYEDLYDQREYRDHDPDTTPLKLRLLGPSVGLLSKVLKSSELVDDVALKREVLKDALHSWGLAGVVLAVEEDSSSDLRDRIGAAFGEDGEEDDPALDRLLELLVTLVIVISVTGSLASAQLEGVLKDVLDDDEFMAPTAHSLFATMFYAMMKFADWPARMEAAYEQHRQHPIVEQMLRTYAIVQYRSEGLSPGEVAGLQKFLANVYARKSGSEKAGVRGRSAILAAVTEDLKAMRAKALRLEQGHREPRFDQEPPIE